MFLQFRALLYSFVFLAGLELIVMRPEVSGLVVVFLIVLSMLEGQRAGKKWVFSILPFFFTISSIALLYLITLDNEQQIFILLSSAMYYLGLLGAYRLGRYADDKTAKGMNMAATAASIFFTFSAGYGFYLNFLVPLYDLMLLYLLASLLLSYQYFYIIKKDEMRIVWVYSFLLSLVMAELIWAMNFWPFGYLTTGVIALILYYVLWDLVQSYMLNLLSRKRVVANMIFFSTLIVLVLLSAKWIPVI